MGGHLWRADPDLRPARLGAEHHRRPRRPARSRLRRLLRGRRLCLCPARAAYRPAASGRCCRSAACSPPSGASASAFRCCACAAIISPSSRWPSREIVRIVLVNWDVVTHGEAGLFGFPRRHLLRPALHSRPARLRRLFRPAIRRGAQADLPVLSGAGAGAARQFRVASGFAACRWARLGGACARTRSPAARSASTPPTSSSPPSRSGPFSPASPAACSRCGRASSRRRASPSTKARPILAIVVLGGARLADAAWRSPPCSSSAPRSCCAN